MLIGQAGRGTDLTDVLSELLERQGVAPEFERRERFRPSALLSENRGDDRVWVFVTESGPRVAKIYFRGPLGKRFLLRKLSLRDGLDELGRELIAQVVETSTVALLRSETGLSREQARARLSDSGDPRDALEADDSDIESASPPESVRAPDAERTAERHSIRHGRPFVFELGARGFAKWSGVDLTPDHGAGVEAALAWHLPRGLFARGRLVVEYGVGQSIDQNGIDARLRTIALRGGADVGIASGRNAFAVGVGGGADLVRISPDAASDASLELAGASTGTIPVLRVETRYELTLGTFRVTAGVFGDASLVNTHYDILLGAGIHRVATPWVVRPGMALTLGWCQAL